MGTIKNIITICIVAVALVSCSTDQPDDLMPGITGRGGDIAFTIGFAPHTRVATDADFNSTWQDGDQIGLFAVTHGTQLSANAADNYIQNVPLTYSSAGGGTWTASESLWWPRSGGRLDFYAYYPYDAAATDPTAITFNVNADQSGTTAIGGTNKSNYNLSDLLTAKSDNAGNGWSKANGATVGLTFTHALAMVQVTVDDRVGALNSSKATVKLRNIQPGAILNLSAADGTTPGSGVSLAATGNDPVGITMHRVSDVAGYVYRALVPAQALAQDASIFLIADEELILQGSKLATAVQMVSGQAETFTQSTPKDALPLIESAGKTFSMGQLGVATPVHNVTLTKSFQMSKCQVTNAQYAAFLNAEGIGQNRTGMVTYYKDNFTTTVTEPQILASSHVWGVTWDTNKWIAQPGYENHPIINVSWFGAKAYADWAGGALPTEAQWEYACRAGSTEEYGMGAYGEQISSGNLDEYAWYNRSETQQVGRLKPNAFGLYDMHGNVFEWCSDWYGSYGNGPDTDPTGPAAGYDRVLRGGSWNDFAQNCRSACRISINPGSASFDFGFRVVFIP